MFDPHHVCGDPTPPLVPTHGVGEVRVPRSQAVEQSSAAAPVQMGPPEQPPPPPPEEQLTVRS